MYNIIKDSKQKMTIEVYNIYLPREYKSLVEKMFSFEIEDLEKNEEEKKFGYNLDEEIFFEEAN